MNGFSGGRHQQGQPGHNQPDSAHLQRSASGVVGHNQRGGFPSMGGGLGGVTSIGGAAIGGQLSVGPNRQIGGGMHSNQAAGRSSMLGHPSGQMPNPHSVGANSGSGNDTMPFGMAGGNSGVGSLGGDSPALGSMQSDLAPSFGVADFPTLGGGAPLPARNTPSSELMAPILGSLGQDFKMADSDFPSLAPAKKVPAEQRASQQVAAPGDLTEGMLGGMTNQSKGGWAGAQQTSQQTDARGGESPWGLLGLLNVIQMSSADLNTMALGTDLTTLGLNLNSTEPLYSTFASPWASKPCQREPEFSLPMCYYMLAPTLKTGHFQKFQLETLFYIFYMLPKDTMQAVAASELHSRDWKFHSELGMWFCKQPESGKGGGFSRPSTYVYFDVKVWERRSYVDSNNNLEQSFLEEDAFRVR